jgi:hypothetical protein
MDAAALNGGLTLSLVTDGDRIAEIALRSERPTALGRTFVGLDGADVITRLPLLFSICGTAQQVAGLTALEKASGFPTIEGVEACRRMAVLAESVSETMRGIVLGWPLFYGGRPDGADFAALAAGRQKLVAGLSRAGDWRRLGARAVNDNDPALAAQGAAEMAAALARGGLDADFARIADAGDVSGYAAWARQGRSVAQRTVTVLLDHGMPDFGTAPFRPLVAGTLNLAERLALDEGGAFQARPEQDGTARETGALASTMENPLVHAVADAHGHGLLARVTARIVELADLAAGLGAPNLGGGEAPVEPPVTAVRGAGVGDIRCARGRLVHWVRLDEEGRVEAYRILAPTEWTFHPDGALARGLSGRRGADRPDFEKHVALLVAAMDPCVACDIAIRERADA